MIAVYQKGDLVRLTAAFTDAAGAVVDPATVTFKATKPSGVLVSKTYPDTIVKDSIGNYRIDISADEPGPWYYHWESTGAGQASEPGQFWVEGV